MKKTILTAATVAVISLGGCAASDGGPSYGDLMAQTEAEMAKAKKMNYLWRDTGKLVDKAKAARADGDNPEAKKLLKKALKQAKLAQAQAMEQKNAGPVYFK
jgi:hypothetical protein